MFKADFSNAFNSINRTHFFNAIAAFDARLLPWAHYTYNTSGRLFHRDDLIFSSTGVQQGDPLGPLFFALGLHPISAWPDFPLVIPRSSSTATPLLGSPIGWGEAANSIVMARVDRLRHSLNAVRHLEDPQQQLLLLRVCVGVPSFYFVSSNASSSHNCCSCSRGHQAQLECPSPSSFLLNLLISCQIKTSARLMWCFLFLMTFTCGCYNCWGGSSLSPYYYAICLCQEKRFVFGSLSSAPS